mmetsp:Transcript_4898/g.7580  ORF Transcript_4898/g.7580 Transcript_4898/m.7580 type:complete len:82 (+) Transcript_4898:692-937(+)
MESGGEKEWKAATHLSFMPEDDGVSGRVQEHDVHMRTSLLLDLPCTISLSECLRTERGSRCIADVSGRAQDNCHSKQNTVS